MELYPGWSARDNYGYVSKKKKRKKDRSPADSGGIIIIKHSQKNYFVLLLLLFLFVLPTKKIQKVNLFFSRNSIRFRTFHTKQLRV